MPSRRFRMPDLDEAVRVLVERPLSPPTPIEVIKRRAHRLIRRRRIATGGAVAVMVVALFAAVQSQEDNDRLHVTSGDGWRTYESHGLVVRYPPGWVVASEPSILESAAGDAEQDSGTVIPDVVLASRPIQAVELAELERSDGRRFPTDLITFEVSHNEFNGIDELGPPGGGLGPPRQEAAGVRRRIGQASPMFDMIARAGSDAPEDQWALVDRIAASVRVPVVDLEDGGPSSGETGRAAVNATRLAASVRYQNAQIHRQQSAGDGYSLLVGERCFKLRIDPPPGPGPGDGMLYGRCSDGWEPSEVRSLEVLAVLQPSDVLVVARVGAEVARIAARRADDGTVVEGVLSADGWGLIVSEGGLIRAENGAIGKELRPDISEILAYDATGQLVWSGPARRTQPR
jgi:hypothetical protein